VGELARVTRRVQVLGNSRGVLPMFFIQAPPGLVQEQDAAVDQNQDSVATAVQDCNGAGREGGHAVQNLEFQLDENMVSSIEVQAQRLEEEIHRVDGKVETVLSREVSSEKNSMDTNYLIPSVCVTCTCI
jgi:hypothetical protein